MVFQATNQLRAACRAVKHAVKHAEPVQQKWLAILNHGHLDQNQCEVESTNQALWERAVSFSYICFLMNEYNSTIW